VNEAIVIEYVELSGQITAQAMFSREVEQRFYDRLDQLWYAEMTDDDRVEAQRRLSAPAKASDDRKEKS
jgi:hypothetical protein